MKRAIAYGLTLAFLATAIAGGVALAWVMGTPDGARWLLKTVSDATPLRISAREVRGSAGRDLRLEGVRAEWRDGRLEADSLRLRWQPLLLVSRKLSVKELSLQGVRIQDNAPEVRKPPDLEWPTMSGLPEWLEGWVEDLRISGLAYRRLNHPPVTVGRLAASLTWRDRFLTVGNLALHTPDGRVGGTIVAGFARPALRVDLGVHPAQPVSGLESFTVQARLLPAHSPEQAAGKFALTAAAGKTRRIALAGEMGMTRTSFNLRDLRLTEEGRRGTVTGAGSLTLTMGEPVMKGTVRLAGVDLARELGRATDLSGTLSFAGITGDYRGNFALANRGPGWQKGSLSGTFRGDRARLALSSLEGNVLGGSVRGEMRLGWQEGFEVAGNLNGTGLNPARITPEWSGVVNLDLRGAARWTGKTMPEGELSLQLHDSRLRGQALAGEVEARLKEDNLRIDRLFLRGNGFDIRADGELAERLNVAAEIGDLSGLVPGTKGQLDARGWVRYRGGRLSGSLAGKGQGLAANGAQVASADLDATIGETEGAPLDVRTTLRKVSYEQVRIESADLEVTGTRASHTMKAELRSAGAELATTLSGGYRAGRWQGTITRLTGRDAVGPWRLTAPAPLAISTGNLSLSPLAIAGAGQERLEAAADLAWKPLRGSAHLSWQKIELSRANQWASGVHLTGSSSGDLSGRLPAADWVEFTGNADATGTATLDGRTLNVQKGTLRVEGGKQGSLAALDLRLADGGMLEGRFASPLPARPALPEQGTFSASWRELDLITLSLGLPSDLDLQGRLAGKVDGTLLPGQRLELKGDSSLSRGKVRWRAEAREAEADLKTANLSFGWQGALAQGKPAGGKLTLKGELAAAGAVTVEGERVSVRETALQLDWGERGMQTRFDLRLADGGALQARFSSPVPAGLTIPEEGSFDGSWRGIDLKLAAPWLPPDIDLNGGITGDFAGKLLSGKRFEARGKSEIVKGEVQWRKVKGELNAGLRKAELSWEWQGETLGGSAALALAERGEARASFSLPLPAVFPIAIRQDGPLRIALNGGVQEKGLITALFPGLVQESHGNLDIDMRVAGTWRAPQLSGKLGLAKAGAYLPPAGIQLNDMQATAHLEGDRLRIDSLSVKSGPGNLTGTASIQLKEWQVAEYSGTIGGDRFQTVHLPELQMQASPKLTFEGTPSRLKVRGDIAVPELLVSEAKSQAPIQPSTDVIIEGAKPTPQVEMPLALDIQVRVTLGDRVLVKAKGIDARLGGALDLTTAQGLDNVRSRGEIRVVKGYYKTYGVDLEIVRGRIFYAGGPIGQPTLDFLALRTVEDVKAGVTVGGTPQTPVIKLYSEPAMPDTDILSYVVLGHPLSGSKEDTSLMLKAAGFLFSASQSVMLQDQIKNRLGIDVLGLTEAPTGTSEYKAIQVAPPGTTPQAQSGAISQSMVTVGKYLTPQLYISYGRSLFTNSNLFRMRYSLSKRLEIETQAGTESGADLFYKIDFN